MFIFVLFKIWANPDLFFVYFHPFLIQIEKALMMYFGFKPRAAEWLAKMKPLTAQIKFR